MFWGGERARQRAVLDRARSVLLAAGLAPDDVRDIFDHLRTAPFDSQRAMPGGGDALGAVLDTLDVLEFLGAWIDGDERTDIDGDGDVNSSDVIAFLNVWSRGCSF